MPLAKIDLVIGTNNPAKFKRYQRILSRYPHLHVLSPEDIQAHPDFIEEGTSAQENARIKATAYARYTGLPALGIDEALYFPALPPEEQPGVLVRRYAGTEVPDEALLSIFLEKARQLEPEQRQAKWFFAVCLALPDGQIYEEEVEFSGMLTDQPHLPYPPGYPLSALLVDLRTGKAISALTPVEEEIREKPLAEMVSRLIHVAGLDEAS
jgi:XTP/dITP diphosphohydrolase